MNKPLIAITGASSGIGAETAKLFSKQGYPLLLMARRIDKMQSLNLSNTVYKKVDVAHLEEVEKAVQEAETTYGPVDCFINNAGFMGLGYIDTQDTKEWKRMLDVNVLGLLNGVRSVFGSMKKRKQGTIINISSIAGIKTFPAHAVYCGTKFAVHGITESLREEASPHGVRVIVISPGIAESELLSHTTSSEIREAYQRNIQETKGIMSSQDVAHAIFFSYQQPSTLNIREITLSSVYQVM